MKFLMLTIFSILLCFVSLLANAQEDNAKRPSILLRRPSQPRPLGNKAGAVGAVASSTTAQPPKSQPENGEENDDEEYDQNEEIEDGEKDQNDNASSTTTSTEPPKKIGPIIRPFRTNDDFLTALKRRQQSSKKGGQKIVEKPTPKQTDNDDEKDEPVPTVASKTSNDRITGRRNKFTAKKTAPAPVTENEDEQPSSSAVRRPPRFNLKTLKSK